MNRNRSRGSRIENCGFQRASARTILSYSRAATVCRRSTSGFWFVFLPCRLGTLPGNSKCIRHRISCSPKCRFSRIISGAWLLFGGSVRKAGGSPGQGGAQTSLRGKRGPTCRDNQAASAANGNYSRPFHLNQCRARPAARKLGGTARQSSLSRTVAPSPSCV